MTLSRRSFSFASLAAMLGVGRTASAAIPEAEQQATLAPLGKPLSDEMRQALDGPIPEVEAAPKAAVSPRLQAVEGGVAVWLSVKNLGAETMIVELKRGSRASGTVTLTALADGAEVELARVFDPVDRREMMSRMGPRPQYTNLASGHSVELGPYTFALPSGTSGALRARGEVYTDDSAAAFDVAGLTIAGKRA